MSLTKVERPGGGFDYLVIADRLPDPLPQPDVFPDMATVLLTRGGVTEVLRPTFEPKE